MKENHRTWKWLKLRVEKGGKQAWRAKEINAMHSQLDVGHDPLQPIEMLRQGNSSWKTWEWEKTSWIRRPPGMQLFYSQAEHRGTKRTRMLCSASLKRQLFLRSFAFRTISSVPGMACCCSSLNNNDCSHLIIQECYVLYLGWQHWLRSYPYVLMPQHK